MCCRQNQLADPPKNSKYDFSISLTSWLDVLPVCETHHLNSQSGCRCRHSAAVSLISGPRSVLCVKSWFDFRPAREILVFLLSVATARLLSVATARRGRSKPGYDQKPRFSSGLININELVCQFVE